ncbi:class I SAM-dependent methyltransferase [Catenulispora subtropica]|uniref:Class I SAM-dependent methyltransferase n=1 Tax=Catenulispora subtropica TaxID=450798 RepID=A0ABP5EC88_9ACTN
MSVQESYDEAAERYAARFGDSLSKYPMERGLLRAFAELAQEVGGPVADVGCGPGHITGFLSSLGLETFGVDLSPGMIEQARKANPALRFEVGSADALDVADGALSGVLSRYAIIHTAPEDVPAVLAEFHRVLAPGGHLLISFPGSDGASPPTQSYDHSVVVAYRWWPDHFSSLLQEAGLEEVGRMIQRASPDAPRPFPVVDILARRSN